MNHRILSTLVLLSAGTTVPLGAQSRATAYVDLTVGSNVVIGNVPTDRRYEGGFGFAFLAFGNQPDVNRSLVAALHFGLFAILGSDASCRPTQLGGCYQDYPFGGLIAVTVGGRPITSPWRVLELTAGPALVGVLDGGNSLGALVAGRIGLPPGKYLSPGLALHGFVAPIDGVFVFEGGVGFSLRTW
jgi:hypothetical protein